MNWFKQAQADDDFDKNFLASLSNPWEQVNSSFVEALAYYRAAAVLEVRLKNGKTYTFMDIPEEVYKAFKASPSKGSFFNDIIRKKYRST